MSAVLSVVGARPQFVKAAMVSRALREAGIEETLVHTGQHYDERMSRIFFDELGMPGPAVNLEVGSGSHAVQTGQMMLRLERWLEDSSYLPSSVLVYGDTNSTLAAAMVAAKRSLPIAHVEAGLRSYNRRMPEEVNRVVTDRLSSVLYCPSQLAVTNLAKEGIDEGVIFAGDVMYDAVLQATELAAERHPLHGLAPVNPKDFFLVTVHRAENTDDDVRFRAILGIIEKLEMPVIWPMHPRARATLNASGFTLPQRVRPIEPVGYLAMNTLIRQAHRVLTDSGGVQKEAFWLGTPCITLRAETEWPETLEGGWNRIVDVSEEDALRAVQADPREERSSPYGDGRAAQRIARHLASMTLI